MANVTSKRRIAGHHASLIPTRWNRFICSCTANASIPHPPLPSCTSLDVSQQPPRRPALPILCWHSNMISAELLLPSHMVCCTLQSWMSLHPPRMEVCESCGIVWQVHAHQHLLNAAYAIWLGRYTHAACAVSCLPVLQGPCPAAAGQGLTDSAGPI